MSLEDLILHQTTHLKLPRTMPVPTFQNACEPPPSSSSTSNNGAQRPRLRNTVVAPHTRTVSLPAGCPNLLRAKSLPFAYDAVTFPIQCSVHSSPRRFKRELRLTFPEIAGKEDGLLIIPTFQPTAKSMLTYYDGSQEEKDEKLFNFYRWAADFVQRISDRGFWADATDPASGLSLFTTSGPSLYPDVEGAEILLRYSVVNVGCCGVLSHPTWGTKVYPATAFTLAPPQVVAEVIDAISAE